ncbi:hypothetical protein Hanom_Chr04g00333021 [Helianthus anomalus]
MKWKWGETPLIYIEFSCFKRAWVWAQGPLSCLRGLKFSRGPLSRARTLCNIVN